MAPVSDPLYVQSSDYTSNLYIEVYYTIKLSVGQRANNYESPKSQHSLSIGLRTFLKDPALHC